MVDPVFPPICKDQGTSDIKCCALTLRQKLNLNLKVKSKALRILWLFLSYLFFHQQGTGSVLIHTPKL